MENTELGSSLRNSFLNLHRYVDVQIKLSKIIVTKKMSEILSLIALFVLILLLSGFFILFLSFAFVYWYTERGGVTFHGYLIVAFSYLLLAILVLLLRNQIIFNPLRKLFGNVLFRDEELGANKIPFDSKEEVQHLIVKYKAELEKETKELKENIDELGDRLTINNIIISIGRSLYDTYMTTTNVSKIAFYLINKLINRKKGG
jgi:energy-coupling factor transporter transmembrane protein EcfT